MNEKVEQAISKRIIEGNPPFQTYFGWTINAYASFARRTTRKCVHNKSSELTQALDDVLVLLHYNQTLFNATETGVGLSLLSVLWKLRKGDSFAGVESVLGIPYKMMTYTVFDKMLEFFSLALGIKVSYCFHTSDSSKSILIEV